MATHMLPLSRRTSPAAPNYQRARRRHAVWIVTLVACLVSLGNWTRHASLGAAEPAASGKTHGTASIPVGAPIARCQFLTPASPTPIPAVDCVRGGRCELGWGAMGPAPLFNEWSQGQYVGQSRMPHVPFYRLRVDDELTFVFRVTRDETPRPYELNVGDELIVESMTDKELHRTLVVLPDGTIVLPLLGPVRAANLTITQLRDDLEKKYKDYYKVPAISVTPTRVDTKLEDLRYTVSGRAGFGGQYLNGRITPEGTVSLPAVGVVPAQGLTIGELKQELDARFSQVIEGIEVTPVLIQRAPRYVFVLGEVHQPGRYTLEGPTTVMQALSMAGSWNVGANVNQIVVFRRAEDWRLVATMLDLRAALLGHRPCPAEEIWVGDSDLIIVPKSKILLADNFIELVFTRGIYGVMPFQTVFSYSISSAGDVIPIVP